MTCVGSGRVTGRVGSDGVEESVPSTFDVVEVLVERAFEGDRL